jgi:RHS repeat-associated protein
MQFTGHERDLQNTTAGTNSDADDLDYMHARYYNMHVGRFTSVDPARSWDPKAPQSWNRYGYALGNPLEYVDPDGREVFLATRNVQDERLRTLAGTLINAKHSFIVVQNDAGVLVLGGYAGEGDVLISARNAPSDVAALEQGKAHLIRVQPPGQSTPEFDANVIRAFDSYVSGSVPYDFLDRNQRGKNSNAFATGVLKAAGARRDNPRSPNLLFPLPTAASTPGLNPGLSDPLKLLSPSASVRDARALERHLEFLRARRH